jgi:hypothetical protein
MRGQAAGGSFAGYCPSDGSGGWDCTKMHNDDTTCSCRYDIPYAGWFCDKTGPYTPASGAPPPP